MQLYTLPDITPAGKVNLGTAAASAGAPNRAVWINATATGATIRIGDTNIGATRGQLLPSGVPFQIAVRGESIQEPYDLAKVFVFGAGGDSVSITYGY